MKQGVPDLTRCKIVVRAEDVFQRLVLLAEITDFGSELHGFYLLVFQFSDVKVNSPSRHNVEICSLICAFRHVEGDGVNFKANLPFDFLIFNQRKYSISIVRTRSGQTQSTELSVDRIPLLY